MNGDGVEFGEERLQACLTAYREAPVAGFLKYLLDEVRDFTAGADQSDDLSPPYSSVHRSSSGITLWKMGLLSLRSVSFKSRTSLINRLVHLGGVVPRRAH
jgi:serine phosphatase RsbU (regulator of sigma subunit)